MYSTVLFKSVWCVMTVQMWGIMRTWPLSTRHASLDTKMCCSTWWRRPTVISVSTTQPPYSVIPLVLHHSCSGVTDVNGETPLDIATRRGHTETADYLKSLPHEYGPSPTKKQKGNYFYPMYIFYYLHAHTHTHKHTPTHTPLHTQTHMPTQVPSQWLRCVLRECVLTVRRAVTSATRIVLNVSTSSLLPLRAVPNLTRILWKTLQAYAEKGQYTVHYISTSNSKKK